MLYSELATKLGLKEYSAKHQGMETSHGTRRYFFSRRLCRPGVKGSQGSSRCSVTEEAG
jgi:hypothetical protein